MNVFVAISWNAAILSSGLQCSSDKQDTLVLPQTLTSNRCSCMGACRTERAVSKQCKVSHPWNPQGGPDLCNSDLRVSVNGRTPSQTLNPNPKHPVYYGPSFL